MEPRLSNKFTWIKRNNLTSGTVASANYSLVQNDINKFSSFKNYKWSNRRCKNVQLRFQVQLEFTKLAQLQFVSFTSQSGSDSTPAGTSL